MSPHATHAAKLLVVDDNPTGRFVICDLLRDRFHGCAVLETDTARAAFSVVRHEPLSAILCHRARGMADATLVRALRTIRSDVPIISTSDATPVGSLINAGATKFVRYGAWATIGAVVGEVLAEARAAHRAPAPKAARTSSRPPLKIVVAHDDQAVRTHVCAQFGQAPGVAVHDGGETSIDALQLVRSIEPDLAVVDVAMLDRLDLAVSLGLVGCLTQFAYLLVT